jgi:hypothetical protein
MTWRAFVKPPTLLFLALWLILMVGGRSRFFQDSDTFWHTAVGDKILKDGFFDKDPYSFTRAGEKWIPNQWLGEVLMALAHSIGGLDTLLLGAATILAALFTWLGVRLMCCGLHPAIAAVLVALAMAASSGHFHIRPHLATMVGFAITMAFLCDFETKRISLRQMTWLIPIYLVWSNIHGGVLGGLATFALAIFGWTLLWKIGWESPVSSRRQAGTLVLIWLGCAATAFVNPYGWRLPAAWLDIYRMGSLPELIKEHAPLNVRDPNAWMILLMAMVYVGLLAMTRPRFASGSDRQPRLVWLLPLVWLILGVMRVRHAPLFAIGTLIAIADLFPRTSLAKNWQARGSDLFVPPNPTSAAPVYGGAAFALPILLVALALSLQATNSKVLLIGRDWAQLDPQIWPVEIFQNMRFRERRSEKLRMFNEYAYGGFLIYHDPDFAVFIDGRTELYGEEFLKEYVNPDGVPPTELITRWEAKYGKFNYALVGNYESPCYADHFRQSPDWIEDEKTDTAILYHRIR